MKKIVKVILLCFILLFIILFLNRNYYYENRKILSDDSIKQFEKDLKEGKNIDPNNYITEEKQYNNSASKLGLKVSGIIEKVVGVSLRKALNYLR